MLSTSVHSHAPKGRHGRRRLLGHLLLSLFCAQCAAPFCRAGNAEGALVAGVLLCLVPQSTAMLQRAGMIAPDGRCKTLDAAADGYVRAETCRTMYLVPPSQGTAKLTSYILHASCELT